MLACGEILWECQTGVNMKSQFDNLGQLLSCGQSGKRKRLRDNAKEDYGDDEDEDDGLPVEEADGDDDGDNDDEDDWPVEEDDELLAGGSNLRVWMRDCSTPKLGQAVGGDDVDDHDDDEVVDDDDNNTSNFKVTSYFLTHIGSPSSSLSPYSATRNL